MGKGEKERNLSKGLPTFRIIITTILLNYWISFIFFQTNKKRKKEKKQSLAPITYIVILVSVLTLAKSFAAADVLVPNQKS